MEYVIPVLITLAVGIASYFFGRKKTKEEVFDKKVILPSPKKQTQTTEAKIEKATDPTIDIRTKLEWLRDRARQKRGD